MSQGGPYKIGQRFGPYTIEEYLGSGAFKSVYRARDAAASHGFPIVALGFPHQQDPDGLEEMRKEFAVAVRLQHPNILRVFAAEEHAGIFFLVMEYLAGVSLRATLREKGSLDPPEALRITGLVSEALGHAHASRVLHRDVKPENIFLTKDGSTRLLDFGVARILERASQKVSTRTGTMEYLAPEALQGAFGSTADLWALGVTLYEMLSGQRPYRGELAHVVQKILDSAPVDEAPLRAKRVDNRIIRVLRKLLRKDPEQRYPTAEDVANDLAAVLRSARIVDDDEGRIEVFVRASYPLIGVVSYEEDRVVAAVRSIAARLTEERRKERRVYVWSATNGLAGPDGRTVQSDTAGDATAAFTHAIENPDDAIYVFLDMHRHFTPVTTRLVRDAARAVRMTRKSVIFVSPVFQFPDELQKEVVLVGFHPPDAEQMLRIVGAIENECRDGGLPVNLSDGDRHALLRALAGFTANEAERALRRAVQRQAVLGPEAAKLAVEEKTQVIRRGGILEYYHSSESFKNVGGLELLVEWFKQRAGVFSGAARFAGLRRPRGVMLVGVPGCGKSLSARALAGLWGAPLLRLDIGRVFGSLVGESESNMHRALVMAEAVSPCILWIDEIEKGFSGVQSHSGGGVTARVFGAFLTWLQESRAPVFVVATANDISRLPPELLRKGRLDEVFFVGLPDATQRETILRIHLRGHAREPERFDLKQLSAVSARFSGAELEQAVVEGLFTAFGENRELLTGDIESAMQTTFPLARSRAREIAALTAWADRNARQASRSHEAVEETS